MSGMKLSSYAKINGSTSSEKNSLSFSYDKFKKKQYNVSFFAIFSKDTEKQLDLTAYIYELKIFNIFTDLVFPVVKISLMLNKKISNKITSDFKKIKFRLSIDMIDEMEDPEDQRIVNKTVIGKTYIKDVILVPNDMSRAKFEDLDYIDDDNEASNARYDYKLELELFKKEHLDINKKAYNTNYENEEDTSNTNKNTLSTSSSTKASSGTTTTATYTKTSSEITTPSQNAKIIWDWFKQNKGLNDYAIAGIIGNLYAESSLTPNKMEKKYANKLGYNDTTYTNAVDSGTYSREDFKKDKVGYGLPQFTYWSYKLELYDTAKARGVSISDIGLQLDCFWKQLEGIKGIIDGLKKASSVLEASNIILLKYERPTNQSEENQYRRASFGNSYYELYASKTSSASAVSTFASKSTSSSKTDDKLKELSNLINTKTKSTTKTITRKNGKITIKEVLNMLIKDIKEKVYLYEPDNTKEYDQIILIGSTWTQSIYYLQNVYGIYYSGVRVFFDFDRGYIIPRSQHDLNFLKKKITDNIIYIGSTLSDSEFVGSYKDTKNSLIHILTTSASNFTYDDVSTKELYGESVKIRSSNATSKNNSTTVTQKNLSYSENNETESSNSLEGIVKERMYYNKYDNNYLTTEVLYNNSAKLKFLVHLSSTDWSSIKIASKYGVTFLDEDLNDAYKGIYSVESMVISFSRFSQNIFNSVASLEMCKSSMTDKELKYFIDEDEDDEEDESTYFYYTVQKGDSLYSLAQTYYNNSELWVKIYEDNKDKMNSDDPTHIYEGEQLKIFSDSKDKLAKYFTATNNVDTDTIKNYARNNSPTTAAISQEFNTSWKRTNSEYIDTLIDSEWRDHCNVAFNMIHIGSEEYWIEKQQTNSTTDYLSKTMLTGSSLGVNVNKAGSFFFSLAIAASNIAQRIISVRHIFEASGFVFSMDGSIYSSNTSFTEDLCGSLGKCQLAFKNLGLTNVTCTIVKSINKTGLEKKTKAYIIWCNGTNNYTAMRGWTCVLGMYDDQCVVLNAKEKLISPSNVNRSTTIIELTIK